MNESNEYAVIDLGSNSFHMVVVRYLNGAMQIVYKHKINVHLATGLNTSNELSQSSIARGIECLALFSERLKDFSIKHVKVVATYTLRVAKNRHHFISEAAKVLPYPIEIISGQEEARLIYLGMRTTESTAISEVKFVLDIGGGSTEIAVGTDFKPRLVISRPMGCVTYTKQFFPQQKIDKISFYRAKLAAEQQMENIINVIKKQNISIAFGTSGTIKSIHTILVDMGVTDGIITPKRLNDLVSYTLKFKSFQDIDFPSLSEERKHVFVSGLAIFYGVFNALGLQELHYSQSALREGVLYELIGDHSYQDIRQNTAESLSKQYSIDEKHAHQVVKTAKYLFQQWCQTSPIIIDPSLEAILYWAAQLHELGLNINFSSIHKHSSYILQNSNLPGFNEEQQLLLSTLVRYHRKSINPERLPYFSLFEYKYINPLLQIIRLAILINNQRTNELDLTAFQLKTDKEEYTKITLAIKKDFVEHNKLIQLDLEQEQKYWQTIKNWQLNVEIIKE